jgi:DNA-binding CsgD family transcriptional regulator
MDQVGVEVRAEVQHSWPIAPRDEQVAAGVAALQHRPAGLLLIEGGAGVGKSALASAIASRLGRSVTITGDLERATTPLGAFEDLLSGLGIGDDSALSDLVAALGRVTEGRVLIVDDAPRLDTASAEVVRRLVHGFGLSVIASARSGETLPPALRVLDDEGLVRRQQLDGLSVAEVGRILESRFRVPAREEDVQRLAWQTEGNPLHLRVIVDAAIAAGEVLHRGDFVQIDSADDNGGLTAILAARLATLTEPARQLLWVVALTQPVPRALVDAPGRDELLTDLLRTGLVVAEPETERVTIAHPLVAESLDPSTRADDTVAEALRLLRASGDPTRRFAAVELEHRSGRRTSADELVWAAAYAANTGEHRLAAELADASIREPARRTTAFAAHLAAANYHSLAHDLDDADRLFALAETLATQPGERAALASGWGEHLVFRRLDPAAGLALGERVRATLSDPVSVALDADLWRWRVLAERGSGDDGVVEAGIRASIAAVVAASMRGEPAAARAAARPLTAVSGTGTGPLASDVAIAVGLQRFVELRSAGAAEPAAEFLESARATAGDEVGFVTVMLAAQRTQEGRLADGLRLSELAVDQLRRSDSGELLSLALALRATVNAQRGAVELAREQLAELDDATVSGAAVLQRAECRAFLLAAEGDLRGAADTIIAVVADAVGSGYRFLGALTLSTALRFGEVARTAALAQTLCEGLAEHVEPCLALSELVGALRDGRADRVAPAAQRLSRAGLVPAAIDGLALATALPASAAVSRRLHSVALSLAAGVDAPSLQLREGPALTPRELSVAQAAATRLRSREIAEQLGVSARTVENQLQTVYRKLGVTSRDELRGALRDIGLLTDEDQPLAGDTP